MRLEQYLSLGRAPRWVARPSGNPPRRGDVSCSALFDATRRNNPHSSTTMFAVSFSGPCSGDSNRRPSVGSTRRPRTAARRCRLTGSSPPHRSRAWSRFETGNPRKRARLARNARWQPECTWREPATAGARGKGRFRIRHRRGDPALRREGAWFRPGLEKLMVETRESRRVDPGTD